MEPQFYRVKTTDGIEIGRAMVSGQDGFIQLNKLVLKLEPKPVSERWNRTAAPEGIAPEFGFVFAEARA